MANIPSRWGRTPAVHTIGAVTLAVAAFLELFAWAKFPFEGYDSFSHIYWIAEWHKLWQFGIYYPRWLPDSFHGFGAPSFYYYPPLPFFLSSVLYGILPNFSADDIGKILGLCAFLFSFFSMRLYLGWRAKAMSVPSRSSIITAASLLYAFAPYRIFNYATRGALPEHMAFGLVPFVFWGLDLCMRKNTRSGSAMLVLSLALLILTNMPAAAVAGIGIVLYVLVQKKPVRGRGFSWLLLSSIGSLLVTAFYLVPIGAMFGDVQMERLWRPVPLVQSSPFLAIFTGEALTINSYTFVMLVGACVLFFGWLRSGNRSQPFFWIIAFIIVAQLPVLTQYLYRFVPPFTIVQLASRFSILLILVTAIAWQDELGPTITRSSLVSIVVLFWSVCTIGLVSLQLADIHFHKHGPLPISDAPEYATRWAKPYYEWGDSLATPFVNHSQNIVWPAKDSASVISSIRTPYSDTIDYMARVPSQAVVRRSYWPSWKATVDGKIVATAPDSLGRITLTVPEGKHELILNLETSHAAETGSWVSLCSLIALIIGWIVSRKSKSSKSSA